LTRHLGKRTTIEQENTPKYNNENQEHYTLTTPRRDLGPGPSLDLSFYPLLQAPWAYRTLPPTGCKAPRGARTSIIFVSLVPTVRFRCTNILKFICWWYQTLTSCDALAPYATAPTWRKEERRLVRGGAQKGSMSRDSTILRGGWGELTKDHELSGSNGEDGL
jgi:hypothetical protein